ncbi:hypothetical protein [Candidatus Villigracilis saccharophilus]|uniref:protein kinase domain-containing protein n=1 Tax=Candidatus Villigracilis saccharophilus TaxID=3140684 RepID=UPI0031F1B192
MIDFGLTKHISDHQAGVDTAGTPGCYLPPEILSPNGKWTQAGDVWSLGCLFLVMLYGLQVCTSSGPQVDWMRLEKELNQDFVKALKKLRTGSPLTVIYRLRNYCQNYRKPINAGWIIKKEA